MNLIGLTLLAIASIIAFFGFGRRFFTRLAIKPWLMFLFILIFTIGAIVPVIKLSEVVLVSVSGFIVPIIFASVLFYTTSAKEKAFHLALSILIISASTLALLVAIHPTNVSFYIISAVAVGLTAAIASYIITKNRTTILIATSIGIVLGDAIYNILMRFLTERPIALGGGGTFDAIILASIAALVLLEIVEFVKSKQTQKRQQFSKNRHFKAINFEAGEDIALKEAREKLEKEIFAPFE
ncbi:MAG: DUF1614 domain-containing protein [Firmicutes bacterium]|nr:DUF1614 domain-containing protein [Bacillota bacterium]